MCAYTTNRHTETHTSLASLHHTLRTVLGSLASGDHYSALLMCMVLCSCTVVSATKSFRYQSPPNVCISRIRFGTKQSPPDHKSRVRTDSGVPEILVLFVRLPYDRPLCRYFIQLCITKSQSFVSTILNLQALGINN